jgi:hypothetical protein
VHHNTWARAALLLSRRCAAAQTDHTSSACCLQGDIILVGLRDYQDEKADVILKCAPTLLNPARHLLLMPAAQLKLNGCHLLLCSSCNAAAAGSLQVVQQLTLSNVCAADTWQTRRVVSRHTASCQTTVRPDCCSVRPNAACMFVADPTSCLGIAPVLAAAQCVGKIAIQMLLMRCICSSQAAAIV